MMAFLLFNEHPGRVLMIGLGGGSLAKFVYHRIPEARLEVIEVNPRVLAIARSSFQVPQDDARFAVRLGDGAEWVARPGPPFDAIMLDGYDGASQVAALATPQFYETCRRRLAAGGVLVVNLWGNDRRFEQYLDRIESAFPAATLCLPAEKPGNVIVFGFRDPPGTTPWDELSARGRALEGRYGLEFGRFVRALARMNRSTKECLFMGPALERRENA